ncbi:hypothetical protein [Bauldia litoralis]|uniref:hypothetical protein n=1 Tax=Bauldia litoralis TaxID=665467 RepID=UPI003262DFE1
MVDISDHALVRFIERYKGVSLDDYRKEMTAAIERHKSDQVAPGGTYEDGFLFVVQAMTVPPRVVTVLPPNWRAKHKDFGCELVRVPPERAVA